MLSTHKVPPLSYRDQTRVNLLNTLAKKLEVASAINCRLLEGDASAFCDRLKHGRLSQSMYNMLAQSIGREPRAEAHCAWPWGRMVLRRCTKNLILIKASTRSPHTDASLRFLSDSRTPEIDVLTYEDPLTGELYTEPAWGGYLRSLTALYHYHKQDTAAAVLLSSDMEQGDAGSVPDDHVARGLYEKITACEMQPPSMHKLSDVLHVGYDIDPKSNREGVALRYSI